MAYAYSPFQPSPNDGAFYLPPVDQAISSSPDPRGSHHHKISLKAPSQKVMPSFDVATIMALGNSSVIRVSELEDENLVSSVGSFVGMKGSKSFQVVDMNRMAAIFVATDDTNFCERNCLLSSCRPQKLRIFEVPNAGAPGSTGEMKPLVKLDKPGCHSGAMSVTDIRTGAKIGSIKTSVSCSKMQVSISDANRNKLYVVSSSRFGLTWWVGKLPFGSLRSIPFHVENAMTNKPAASIANEWGGLCREFLTDTDDYFIEFGTISDVTERLLLIASIMHIDDRFFSGHCAGWTVRGMATKYFKPLAYATKYGKYIPQALGVAQAAVKK